MQCRAWQLCGADVGRRRPLEFINIRNYSVYQNTRLPQKVVLGSHHPQHVEFRVSSHKRQRSAFHLAVKVLLGKLSFVILAVTV